MSCLPIRVTWIYLYYSLRIYCFRVFVLVYVAKGTTRQGGSGSEGSFLTYAARIKFEAEGTTSSTKIWNKEKAVTTPRTLYAPPQPAQKAETIKIDTAGYSLSAPGRLHLLLLADCKALYNIAW